MLVELEELEARNEALNKEQEVLDFEIQTVDE